MDQSPTPQGGSPLDYDNDFNFGDFPASIENSDSCFFEEAMQYNEEQGTKFGSGDVADECYSHTNDFNNCGMANNSDAQRSSAQDPRLSEQPPSIVSGDVDHVRRGMGNVMASSSPRLRNNDTRAVSPLTKDSPPSEPSNIARESFSPGETPAVTMPSSLFSSSPHSSAPAQVAAGTSKYGGFQNRFDGSDTAKNFRHTSMRFSRVPWKAPEVDPTIEEVESNRPRHVERIYNAMVRGDMARDNEGSTAMKRWVYDANYPSALVEAYAHKVFDAMLEQVKLGFRGWNQNDYVVDERKGEDDDRDVDCAARLDNIVTALECEKSICENVMSSSNQIRMFVNAPKAYSKRKNQNRVGNGKRPNAKGLIGGRSDVLPAKKRRLARAHARNCSPTVSDLPCSRGNTPQESRSTNQLPYFAGPASYQRVAASPQTSPDFVAPCAPPMYTRGALMGHNNRDFQPSSVASTSAHVPHGTLGASSLQPPLLSPPNPRQGYFAPSTLIGEDPTSRNWPMINRFQEPMSSNFQVPEQANNNLFMNMADWDQQASPFAPVANFFEQGPTPPMPMAHTEAAPFVQPEGVVYDDAGDFMSFWQQQDGVQPFSFDDPQPARQNQS